MTEPYEPGSVLDDVAVFPLPQVVLFPGALMPLHVFETRYRAMTRDVIASDRRICIVQIPEDHGADSRGRPDIAPVGGVGEIVKCDVLPDGRFNILVQGKARAAIAELPFKRPYRRARLTVLDVGCSDADPAEVRALVSTATRVAGVVRQCHPGFRFCLPRGGDPSALVDACAHYLVLDGADRQSLLETLDVPTRLQMCLKALIAQQTVLGAVETLH